MEEIWKDIPNLSSLKNPNNSFDAVNLQEFLARPFMYPNYNLNPVLPATTAAPTNLFPAGHATNSVVLLRPHGNSSSSHPALSNMTCSSQKQQHLGLGMQSSGSSRKRIAISPSKHEDQNNSLFRSDRHHQRLIKNRESAARSRDRKEVGIIYYNLKVSKQLSLMYYYIHLFSLYCKTLTGIYN